MHRSFVHLELHVDDTDRAGAFYRALFGWDVVEVPLDGQSYTEIRLPAGPGAGIQAKVSAEAPTAWVPYVRVPSIAETVRKARDAGAQVKVEHTVVPGYGALAVIEDPAGAWLGLWEVADEAEPEAVEKRVEEPSPAASQVERPKKKRASRAVAGENEVTGASSKAPASTKKPASPKKAAQPEGATQKAAGTTKKRAKAAKKKTAGTTKKGAKKAAGTTKKPVGVEKKRAKKKATKKQTVGMTKKKAGTTKKVTKKKTGGATKKTAATTKKTAATTKKGAKKKSKKGAKKKTKKGAKKRAA